MLAVAFLGRDGNRDLAAVLLALERLLEARDQVAVPLNIGQRLAAGRTIDHGTGVVLERVVNQYDSVCSNFHGVLRRGACQLSYDINESSQQARFEIVVRPRR